MDGPVRPEKSGVETWRYSLPNEKGEGWVIAFLDSTGCFTALSDWGDVAYRWSAGGWGEGDFRQFLLQCDDYYLTAKFGRNRREYDPEASLKAAKRAIIETRRHGTFDKEEARAEWDRLKDYDDLGHEYDFGMFYNVTKLQDFGECHCTRYVSDVTAFVKHAMPRLRDEFRKSLNLPQPRFRVVLQGAGWRGHACADVETLDEAKRSVRYALTSDGGYFKSVSLFDKGLLLAEAPATVQGFEDVVSKLGGTA